MAYYFLPLEEQMHILQELIHKAEVSLKNKPDGGLIIFSKSRPFAYYRSLPGTKKRTYLTSQKMELIKALAQKAYDQKFLSIAYKIEKELENLSALHAERSAAALYRPLAAVYTTTSEPRKELISPYVLPDAMFIQQWLSVPYTGRRFSENTSEILTDRGERVRSKSEKIIADKLLALGIPYRYEYPILVNEVTVYSDFTLLDVQERTEVLMEHFGMMQDPEYSVQALIKIDSYQLAGFHPGEKLLLSFEGESHVLQSRPLERMLLHRFRLTP